MKMADLNINSKYKMLSGYDIPVLGYGVSKYFFIFIAVGKMKNSIYETGLLRPFKDNNKLIADAVIDRFIKRTIVASLIKPLLITCNQTCRRGRRCDLARV